VEFRTKNYYQVKTTVKYEHKDISNSTETKFLGLIIDETLSWNQHIDHTATKLCSACYALRNLKHIVPQSTLRTIYYAFIHSIFSYGIIFGGRSSNANKLFILQKKIFRIVTNSGIRESCREAFKNMQIMTMYSQYIFSLILFTVKNKHLFTPNKEIRKYKTRNNTNLHLKDKGQAVPLQAWSGPEGSRKLRFPEFTIRTQDGGKVVRLTHRPPLHPGNTPGTLSC
jgi:hypothetical protein